MRYDWLLYDWSFGWLEVIPHITKKTSGFGFSGSDAALDGMSWVGLSLRMIRGWVDWSGWLGLMIWSEVRLWNKRILMESRSEERRCRVEVV